MHQWLEEDTERIHRDWHAPEQSHGGSQYDPPTIKYSVVLTVHCDAPEAAISGRADGSFPSSLSAFRDVGALVNNDLFLASLEPEIAIAVAGSQVSRMQPAAAQERVRRTLIVPISDTIRSAPY